RLYRQAPLNSLWEGSGNVQCLDLARILKKKASECRAALQDELQKAAGKQAGYDRFCEQLLADLAASCQPADMRILAGRLCRALQAAILLQSEADWGGEAFCQSRLAYHGGTGMPRASALGEVRHALLTRASVS